MREIKFRAWDKEEKSLITGDDNQGSIFGEEGGYFDLREEPNRYELMQFTGLKDKNGKEIYEGDILNLPKTSYHLSFKVEVVFQDGSFVGDSFLAKDLGELASKSEIIGNIYENPELLK